MSTVATNPAAIPRQTNATSDLMAPGDGVGSVLLSAMIPSR